MQSLHDPPCIPPQKNNLIQCIFWSTAQRVPKRPFHPPSSAQLTDQPLGLGGFGRSSSFRAVQFCRQGLGGQRL